MNFKEIELKKAYSSDFDDILFDFYIPVLEASVEYKRLAGFFSSTTLAIAARGISGLIKNGGFFRLIVSPNLSKEDLEVIINSHEKPEKYIEKKMLDELETLENEFVRDHVYALGWLLANKKLEIKVAIAYNNEGNPLSYESLQKNGLFHQKVGILRDSEGNIITFSGSINETVAGWLGNIEEFKVFRSWEPSEEDYIDADISKFERFWNNQSQKIKILDVPQAVKNKLISLAPREIGNIDLAKWTKRSRKRTVELFDYQKEAVKSWCQNNMKGIFEMATGTGKTFTALGCLEKVLEERNKLLTVITCPYDHLVKQWIKQIEYFPINSDLLIICDSSNERWKDELADAAIDVKIGNLSNVLILTTHTTFSSETFMEIIKSCLGKVDMLLIADEVHGLGAKKRMQGLLEDYNFRLGLSATPRRWFDDIGTDKIFNFFGKTAYEFSLGKAINTINTATDFTFLTPFRYFPYFVTLTKLELEEYVDKTSKIIKNLSRAGSEEEKKELIEMLIFARANIVKKASQKYGVLEGILENLDKIEFTLIYCVPEQIDQVIKIVKGKEIIFHKFTMAEGTTPEAKFEGISEREFILKQFGEGAYQVLVAMKCLDEGVDMPPAKTAILMASSGNPREYIQRIGRVIRRFDDKKEASIYDIIVAPSKNSPKEWKKIEKKIFMKELERCKEISKTSLNYLDTMSKIEEIQDTLF